MKLPGGFRYSATYAGIRKAAKDDLALIVSEGPASCAAMFTQNRAMAAPVIVSKEHLKKSGGVARAILVNAGNANCATRTGERVARSSVRAAARALGVEPEDVLPASTGVIGVELDARKIIGSVPELVASLRSNAFTRVADAILTTDTRRKVVSVATGGVTIAGMTKGAGMIHPRMATTLGFVMTDAEISPRDLRSALKFAIERSYNRISVDGDTSTNDMVAVLASGAAGPAPRGFADALASALESLAVQIVRDGEGARKLITIDVEGASSNEAAENIARAIANSPLVKTAIAGSDPNWGRIISAAGNSGVEFDPRQVDIRVMGVRVCRGGVAAPFDERALKRKLNSRDCSIEFAIKGPGIGRARFWTCDFTERYIEINASYRT